jgi:hypothetical protein
MKADLLSRAIGPHIGLEMAMRLRFPIVSESAFWRCAGDIKLPWAALHSGYKNLRPRLPESRYTLCTISNSRIEKERMSPGLDKIKQPELSAK